MASATPTWTDVTSVHVESPGTETLHVSIEHEYDLSSWIDVGDEATGIVEVTVGIFDESAWTRETFYSGTSTARMFPLELGRPVGTFDLSETIIVSPTLEREIHWEEMNELVVWTQFWAPSAPAGSGSVLRFVRDREGLWIRADEDAYPRRENALSSETVALMERAGASVHGTVTEYPGPVASAVSHAVEFGDERIPAELWEIASEEADGAPSDLEADSDKAADVPIMMTTDQSGVEGAGCSATPSSGIPSAVVTLLLLLFASNRRRGTTPTRLIVSVGALIGIASSAQAQTISHFGLVTGYDSRTWGMDDGSETNFIDCNTTNSTCTPGTVGCCWVPIREVFVEARKPNGDWLDTTAVTTTGSYHLTFPNGYTGDYDMVIIMFAPYSANAPTYWHEDFNTGSYISTTVRITTTGSGTWFYDGYVRANTWGATDLFTNQLATWNTALMFFDLLTADGVAPAAYGNNQLYAQMPYNGTTSIYQSGSGRILYHPDHLRKSTPAHETMHHVHDRYISSRPGSPQLNMWPNGTASESNSQGVGSESALFEPLAYAAQWFLLADQDSAEMYTTISRMTRGCHNIWTAANCAIPGNGDDLQCMDRPTMEDNANMIAAERNKTAFLWDLLDTSTTGQTNGNTDQIDMSMADLFQALDNWYTNGSDVAGFNGGAMS